LLDNPAIPIVVSKETGDFLLQIIDVAQAKTEVNPAINLIPALAEIVVGFSRFVRFCDYFSSNRVIVQNPLPVKNLPTSSLAFRLNNETLPINDAILIESLQMFQHRGFSDIGFAVQKFKPADQVSHPKAGRLQEQTQEYTILVFIKLRILHFPPHGLSTFNWLNSFIKVLFSNKSNDSGGP
jgi:hypothetical protein